MRAPRSLVAALLGLSACGGGTPPPEPSYPDGGAASERCGAACENLRRLGCPEGEPTEDGTTCEELCRRVETESGLSVWPACVEELDHCPMGDECTYSTERP